MSPIVLPSESTAQPASPLFALTNRTIAITGGGRGLGITLASAVLEAGGDVACLDLLPVPSAEEWAAVQKLAAARELQVTYVQCDVTDEVAVQAALENIAAVGLERGMPLRGLITCAGIQQMVPALEYPVDLWRKMLDVKYAFSIVSFLIWDYGGEGLS
jgi:NAD(P)-dependent dehydrogenase (short-subunit alcohol dehydrogenase family)